MVGMGREGLVLVFRCCWGGGCALKGNGMGGAMYLRMRSGAEWIGTEQSGTERNRAERSGTERNEEISMEIRHIWHDWYSKTWLKNDKKEPPKKNKNLHFIVLLIFLQTSFPFFFSDMITMIKVIFQMDEFYKKMLTTIRSTLETRFPL